VIVVIMAVAMVVKIIVAVEIMDMSHMVVGDDSGDDGNG
jgi:hypothetical protein